MTDRIAWSDWVSWMPLVVLLCLAGRAPGNENPTWTGQWDARWRGSGAVFIMEQDGDKISGTVPLLEAKLEGRVVSGVMKGAWSNQSGTHEIELSMSPDGQTFMGRFGIGGWATGKRISETSLSSRFDRSSPSNVLFFFLMAGNTARDGRAESLAVALELLDFRRLPDSILPRERVELSIQFYRVLDQLTFHIWEVDRLARDRDDLVITAVQEGTGVTVEIQFVAESLEDGTRRWSLVLPTREELDAALAQVLEVRGGELPHFGEHNQLASPRDTMQTFIEEIDNAQNGDSELFLSTMNLSRLPMSVRAEEGMLLGIYLKEVIDRIGYVIWQEIPNYPGRRAPYEHFLHPMGMVQIAPFPQEDGSRIWQFTPDTLETVRALYIALEDLPKSEFVTADKVTPFFKLRNVIRSYDRGLLKPLGGLERWQWLALVIVICISIPIGWLVTGLMGWLLRYGRLSRGRMAFRKEFRIPTRLLIIGILLLVSLRFIGLPESYDVPLRVVVGVILSVSGAWLALQLISRVSELYGRYGDRLGYHDEILRSLVTSLLKVAVVIGAIIFLASILSIPVQGVVAGLGIGGLAVALAARSTIENFIGGITLFADKPIQVGDLCRVGERLGTVEAIGLRSVRLRGVDRVLVTIPNTEFVNLNIENLTRRDRILLKTTIQLRYETTPDQMRWVLAEVRKMLLQHPFVSPDPARARFVGFGASSMDIQVVAYLETTDFNIFLAVQEDIFLRMIDIVDASGTSFAFPSVVNYLARDGGTDEEQRARVEAIVKQWRDSSALPFPNFTDAQRSEFSGKLDYPPKGSSQALP